MMIDQTRGFPEEIAREAERYIDVYNAQVAVTERPEWLDPTYTLVTGSGDSYAAAFTGAYLAGKPAATVDPAGLALYSTIKPRYLIAVSLGGRTRAVISAAEVVKENGGRVVAVTANPDSPIAGIADYVVETVEKRYVGGSGFTTYIAMTSAVATLLGFDDNASKTTLPPLNLSGRPVYVGAGPYEGLAMFLALKHYEIFTEPARWYGLEQFLHAPVFSVSKGETVVLLGRPSDHEADIAGLLTANGLRVIDMRVDGRVQDVLLSQAAWATKWIADKAAEKGLEEPGYRSRRDMAWGLARIIYS